MRGCAFIGNTATDNVGGAGLCFFGSTSSAENCTFYGNAADSGSAMTCWGAIPEISNTIAAFNNGGAAFHCDAGAPGSPSLSCCNIYGNEGGDWTGCIAGQVFFFGNMSKDPRFCDAPSGDLTLHNTSPCAAANNPGCGQIGAYDVGCGPRVLVVNPEGTGDFPTIQQAIDAAWDGDTVELTDGVFTGAGNRDIDMGAQAITLRSQSGNPENCIIDCEGTYADPHRGIYLTDEDMGQSVEGMTIRGGWAQESGGGIYATESGVNISNCVIADCAAGEDNVMLVQGYGGGMYLGTGCSGAVSGCVIAGNQALYGGLGGGTYVYDGAAITFANCTFVSNLADSGAGICVSGGSTVDIENTILAYNILGGAAKCDVTSSATATCTDAYFNEGGNWSGCLAGQNGINGNIYAPPRFCNLAAGDYHIHNTSWCAPANSGGCGLIGALQVGCGPSTYVVNPQGTGDFPTIQEALDAIWPGDTVELTDGVFTGDGNRDILFPGTADITLRSQSGDPLLCVINCQADSADPHYGMTMDFGVDSTALIQGITIAYAYDGAVKCINEDPRFFGCRFDYNAGDAAVVTYSSNSSFDHCSFYGNTAGGMYAYRSHHRMYNCSFITNSRNLDGGALYCTDGLVSANLDLVECLFTANNSGEDGGAIYFRGDSLRISRCVFQLNSAQDRGGAIAMSAPYAFINRSTLAENSASEGGGIRISPDDHVILSNLIIAFSTEGEAVYCDSTSTVMVDCSDFYDNAGGDWVGCVSGEYGVNGNIALNPYFCDIEGYNLRLDVASPCASENSPPGCGIIGCYDTACSQASVPEDAPEAVSRLSLEPANPNPFAGSTAISYAIPGESEGFHTSLKVYDAQGRCVRTLVEKRVSPGRHCATWDGSDEKGRQVASGVYFYRLQCGGKSVTRRMVLIR
jgi:predicted outer membrane repeat protein